MRKIVCAAIRLTDATIICGARHFDKIILTQLEGMATRQKSSIILKDVVQGFIDQDGTFLTREEAYRVALDANQIVRRGGDGDGVLLISEDLY